MSAVCSDMLYQITRLCYSKRYTLSVGFKQD